MGLNLFLVFGRIWVDILIRISMLIVLASVYMLILLSSGDVLLFLSDIYVVGLMLVCFILMVEFISKVPVENGFNN